MPTKTLAATPVEVNDEGFFVDANQWTKEMAPLPSARMALKPVPIAGR